MENSYTMETCDWRIRWGKKGCDLCGCEAPLLLKANLKKAGLEAEELRSLVSDNRWTDRLHQSSALAKLYDNVKFVESLKAALVESKNWD